MRKFVFFKGFTKEFIITNVGGGFHPIRAIWSPQLMEDLGAYHAIDAEEELTRMLSEQLSQEIDREVPRTLLDILANDAEDINNDVITRLIDEQRGNIE